MLKVLVLLDQATSQEFRDGDRCEFFVAKSLDHAQQLLGDVQLDLILLDYELTKVRSLDLLLHTGLLEGFRESPIFIFNANMNTICLHELNKNRVVDVIREIPKDINVSDYIHKIWSKYFEGRLDQVFDAAETAVNMLSVRHAKSSASLPAVKDGPTQDRPTSRQTHEEPGVNS
jgi:hypothetical protein